MNTKRSEWVLDVSCVEQGDGFIAFVPVIDNTVVFGLSCVCARSPGVLVGVVSQHGADHAGEWIKRNPGWQIDYCSGHELVNAVITPST